MSRIQAWDCREVEMRDAGQCEMQKSHEKVRLITRVKKKSVSEVPLSGALSVSRTGACERSQAFPGPDLGHR